MLFLRFFVFYSTKPELKNGKILTFTSKLSSEPKIYNKYQVFNFVISKGERILITTNPEISCQYGDNPSVSGSLNIQPLTNVRLLSMEFSKISFVKNKTPPYLAVELSIRQKIVDTFQNTLSSDYSALMLDIAFGIKNMPYDFSQRLKLVGIVHLIAVSGIYVTMVGNLFFICFLIFKKANCGFCQHSGNYFLSFSCGFLMHLVSPFYILTSDSSLHFCQPLGFCLFPNFPDVMKIRCRGSFLLQFRLRSRHFRVFFQTPAHILSGRLS